MRSITSDGQGRDYRELVTGILLLLVVFVISEAIFYDLRSFTLDFDSHITYMQELAAGQVRFVHFGLHLAAIGLSKLTGLSFAQSFLGLTALCNTMAVWIAYRIMRRFLPEHYTNDTIRLLVLVYLLIGPLYIPQINMNQYGGQGSPNVWHNPTYIACKPFVLGAFYFLMAGITQTERAVVNRSLAIFSGLLFCTTWIKPTFIMITVPAVVLYLLIQRPASRLHATKVLLSLVPAMAVLVVQALLYKAITRMDHANAVGIGFLKVWHVLSAHPLASIGMALAFPIGLACLHFGPLRRDPYLVMSWLMTLAGIAEFSWLYEDNERMGHGNFAWGYMQGMSVLFLFSMIALCRWAQTWDRSNRRETVAIGVCMMLLLLQTVFGVRYLVHLLTGQGVL